MKFVFISLALPSLGEAAKLRATGGPRGLSVRMDAARYLQSTSCLGTFSTAFTVDRCTASSVQAAVSDAMSDEPNCSGVAVESELSVLLGAAEADVAAALEAKCDEAFEGAKVPFRQMTKRGDAFDREFFHGGSDWNDQYQVTHEGSTYHTLSDDASRIMYESVLAETQGKQPIEFPSYLPSFGACSVNAVMCCHVTDRQANDRGGLCTGDCQQADPLSNTDVCLSSMEDSPIAARVKRGLAVYHLNSEGNPSEGSVNCHGFAWSEEDSRYTGNLLFDVAMKQSLYDRGYVKNVPGSPMCGCIEQMPVVTRSDCTKVGSTSETYTLSSTGSALSIELSVSAIELVQCDADENLASLYKELNPASPNAIDTKLVANCTDSVDSKMAAYGYKRSTLEITEAMLSPVDVAPAVVTLKFNAEVASDIAAADFKIYDAADSTAEQLQITAAVNGGLSINLELATLPSSDSSYQVSNLVQVEKKLARMVTLEANSVHGLEPSSWDYINIGDWRMGFACETCSKSHFSFSSASGQTAMILRDTGTQHRGPRTDYHLFDFGASTGPSYSIQGVEFGNKAIQIRDWRIKQIDDTHISISTANGNVARIYRSDGTIHGNVRDFNGFITELGEPTCAYVTSDYVQVGDWRFGAYDAAHLSVSHRHGRTAQIYRGSDGTTHRGPRTDYNTFTFPDGEVLMGTKDGCVQTTGVPNILQIGLNWRIAEMYDTNHLSFSARQPDGKSGNGAKTATIYRNDGTSHRGPRSDYNAFGDVPTYSSSNPVVYGSKAIEIDEWRIVQIDERHLSVSHSGGGVSRVYSNNGYVVTSGSAAYSGWQQDLGTPTCAFMTEKFLQLGDWRIAEMDENHLSVSHRNGYTSSVYRRDGTFHSGWGSKSWNGWDLVATNVLQGSTDGCASVQDALLIPVVDGSGSSQVLVKFNKPMDDSSAETSLYRIYDVEGHQEDLDILSASFSTTDQSLLELNIAGIPSGVTYNVMTVDQVRTRSSVITVPAESSLAIEYAHWDYVQIGGWRFARTCETCTSSHFSVSSQRLLKTSQIFRETGSTHHGPRSDYHGFDIVTSTGLTYSSQPIMFGDKGVQIRDWRIRQIDATHLSVSNENGNVSRIYRADGTVHGNVKDFSGYKIEELGEPTCAFLTSSYLQIGDWRFGEISTHLSVTHKGGKTAMIYRDDGKIFRGPRADFNAWDLQDEEILMGSNDGCGETALFA